MGHAEEHCLYSIAVLRQTRNGGPRYLEYPQPLASVMRSFRTFLMTILTVFGFFAGAGLGSTPAAAEPQWLTHHPRMALIPRRSASPAPNNHIWGPDGDQTKPAGYGDFTDRRQSNGDAPNPAAPENAQPPRPSGRAAQPPRN